MAWNEQLTQLNDVLANMLPFKEDLLPILSAIGIKPANIRFDSKPVNVWHSILNEAETTNRLAFLVEELIKRYPDNEHFKAYKDGILYSMGKKIRDVDWIDNYRIEDKEKIIGAKSTLLPISFLSKGLERAKSVARVVLPTPKGSSVGTGFLTSNNLFFTNNHVISTKEQARDATIQFNYEFSDAGLPIVHDEFKLDPDAIFATSTADDWTCIKISSDANNKFAGLSLKKVIVKKDDFVNIIQHPGGRRKELGLYHNLVTYVDDNIIQYLTDTEPGSSGSPVFNSEWEIVGIHHSGGMLREPGSTKPLLRNEGIAITKVLEGIALLGIKLN